MKKMVDTKDMIKIKKYDRFVLFEHKNTGIKECILKTDLFPHKNEKRVRGNTWERKTKEEE